MIDLKGCIASIVLHMTIAFWYFGAGPEEYIPAISYCALAALHAHDYRSFAKWFNRYSGKK